MDLTDIPAAIRILRREYSKNKAPVVEFMKVQTRDPFRVLVTTILSARTRDEMTTVVATRLFETISSPDDLRRVGEPELAELLHPVGFYKTKAKHLKAMPDALDKHFNGVIPDTVEELCKLPGVGRKTANLVVSVAFDKPGICVDVHVHRICNRWGLIQTSNPLDTEMTLRDTLPPRYWKTWNRYLVSYGQTICKPVRPQCKDCPLTQLCERVDVKG